MLKAVEFFRKRPGMPDDEFYDYWLTNHSKVVMGLQGLVRYTQNHPLPETRVGVTPAYDGVVEVWFENAEALKRNTESSYWPEVVADEMKFIDRPSLALLPTQRASRPSCLRPPRLSLASVRLRSHLR